MEKRRIRLFSPASGANELHLSDILRGETTGGLLMLVATVVALVWANLPGETYQSFAHIELGPLSLAHWAADGLLTIFFFVAGLELKRELVEGSLSRPADAMVPIAAALGGMLVPAGIYVAFNTIWDGQLHGWAIPMATDIAFALAVLAIVGSRLPDALRAFLLTLAIVDDLGAILVIAVFYSTNIALTWLGAALVGVALFWFLQRRRFDNNWVYLVIGLATWWAMLQSGVHATIAGVLLGLVTWTRKDELDDPVDRWLHSIEPWSAGLVVPIFALMAAGVTLSGEALTAIFTNPMPLGIMFGLFFGKVIGVFLGARLTAHFTSAELGPGIQWGDVFGVAQLAGIGFTVALLLSELAFPGEEALIEEAKAAVLIASVVAAFAGGFTLRRRSKKKEQADADASRQANSDVTR